MADLSLKSMHFTTSTGHSYTVVGTKSSKHKSIFAIDTIKNSRGEYKEMNRKETIKFINS